MKDAFYKIGSFSKNPLSNPGWIKWNEKKWGVKAEHVIYQKNGKEFPKLEGIIYRNKRGKILMPLRNPYLPFEFTDSTTRLDRIYVDYQEVVKLFVDDLLEYGLCGNIILPPGFIDSRPFQWAGFSVELRYTFVQDFSQTYILSNKIKNKLNKAVKLGYVVERSKDWQSILDCISYTENEKKFSNRVSVSDIRICAELLGDNNFRGYLVKDHKGKPVLGALRLLQQNGVALAWSQGGIRENMKDGIVQLVYDFVLDDIKKSGVLYFDWIGANIENVALAKSAWGVPLSPQLVIVDRSLKGVLYNYFKPKVKKLLGKS